MHTVSRKRTGGEAQKKSHHKKLATNEEEAVRVASAAPSAGSTAKYNGDILGAEDECTRDECPTY